MRLLARTCEVLARPVYAAAATSPHVVEVRLNQRGLHGNPPNLQTILQAEPDEVATPYGAVVLAYGLCGAATAGLRSVHVPLVMTRTHDCITLLLGSRRRYAGEIAAHPGTYCVQDYLEVTSDGSAFASLGPSSDADARATHAEYVERYGADNADALMEVMGAWRAHYDRAAWIDLGIGTDDVAEERARGEADTRGWRFERLAGELALIRRLVHGDWDAEDFLLAGPGEAIAMSFDEAVVTSIPVEAELVG
jgi:hypothetical protein